MDIVIVSDCCNVEMSGVHVDHGLCPRCGEHCESVDSREYADYIPGLDDGEFQANQAVQVNWVFQPNQADLVVWVIVSENGYPSVWGLWNRKSFV